MASDPRRSKPGALRSQIDAAVETVASWPEERQRSADVRASKSYTPDEAQAYRRLWGEDPPGYTPALGELEVRHRAALAHGARHALCYPGLGGDWLCRHATATDKGCGTLLRTDEEASSVASS